MSCKIIWANMTSSHTTVPGVLEGWRLCFIQSHWLYVPFMFFGILFRHLFLPGFSSPYQQAQSIFHIHKTKPVLQGTCTNEDSLANYAVQINKLHFQFETSFLMLNVSKTAYKQQNLLFQNGHPVFFSVLTHSVKIEVFTHASSLK